jgi:N-acetylglutamate synthase-like GNAT family acetyltransferase
MHVRFATKEDIGSLKALDSWPRHADWERKIRDQRSIVLEDGGKIVGHLRYSLMWCTVPFLEMIFIEAEYRGRGGSRLMLDFLEDVLRKGAYVALLSSSQTNEPEPQQWHVHMGFHANGIIENIADDNIGEVVFRKLL